MENQTEQKIKDETETGFTLGLIGVVIPSPDITPPPVSNVFQVPSKVEGHAKSGKPFLNGAKAKKPKNELGGSEATRGLTMRSHHGLGISLMP